MAIENEADEQRCRELAAKGELTADEARELATFGGVAAELPEPDYVNDRGDFCYSKATLQRWAKQQRRCR